MTFVYLLLTGQPSVSWLTDAVCYHLTTCKDFKERRFICRDVGTVPTIVAVQFTFWDGAHRELRVDIDCHIQRLVFGTGSTRCMIEILLLLLLSNLLMPDVDELIDHTNTDC